MALQSLAKLYATTNQPTPSSRSIFSCPLTPKPSSSLYANPPSVNFALFMYAENSRLCIDRPTVASGTPQTKLTTVTKPSDTIFIAEQDRIRPLTPRSL